MAAQAVVKREEHAVSACPDAQEVVRKKVTACIFHDPVSLGRSAGCACRGTAILADRTSCGKVRVLGMSAVAAMAKPCLLRSLMLPAAAQRFASFDTATASSVYSSKTFGADLATTESSGYWCSAGNHEPGQTVSWTGAFRSRRELLGLTLRWSYAPGEIKVLTSADGGNFQESVGWSKLSRSEPSFEDTVLFPEPVAAKAVKVLMRGAKP